MTQKNRKMQIINLINSETGKINKPKQIIDGEVFEILESIRIKNKIQEDEFWNCVISQAIYDVLGVCIKNIKTTTLYDKIKTNQQRENE